MILASILTILIDGTPVATSHAARIVAGRVMAPLVPVVTRIANTISVHGGTIVIERSGRSVAVALRNGPLCAECVVYVPLAAVVRGLGGSVRFDARAQTLALSFAPGALRTPEPYDMLALPHPAATSLAWPTAPSSTPAPLVAGVPHPRRTPVEVRVPGLQ